MDSALHEFQLIVTIVNTGDSQKVIKAAKEAGGSDHGACVVYCLLVNMRWFRQEATLQLWDAELHKLRAVACGIIAKQM